MDKALAIDFTFNCDVLKTYLHELAMSTSSYSEFMENVHHNDDIKVFIKNYFSNYGFNIDYDRIYDNVCNILEHYWNLYLLHVDWSYYNLCKLKCVDNM